MSIELVVNGVVYEQFTRVSVSIGLAQLASSFEFTAIAEQGNPLPFKGGEQCTILVDGEQVLKGHLEIIQIDYGPDEHSIFISGRSLTADIVDSSLTALELNTPISLKRCIERTIEQLNLDVSVIDNIGTLSDFTKDEDKISAEVGENSFDFIYDLARKRQVLLSEDGFGNLLITRSDPESLDVTLQMKVGNDENNILSSSVSYDHTDRFNKYIVKSQGNISSTSLSSLFDVNTATDQGAEAIDSNVRTGRQFVFRAEKSSSNQQSQERATWEGNIRRTQSIAYSLSVVGFRTDKGVLWDVNKLVNVADDYADIEASMLIDSVSFTFSVEEGSITQLGLVSSDSYLVSLEEPKEIEDVGEDTFLSGI